jgi:uncharacterized protein
MAARHGTALVTGASSGIGELYADRLAQRGYDLVLVGRNGEKLAQLTSRLAGKHGVAAEALVADLGDAAALAQVERRLDTDTSITLLVNSAGLIGGGPLSDGNLEPISQMLAVNVIALTRLATVAAKVFSARGTGAIINLASAMALIDSAGAAAYAASKAYVLSLSQSLDLDVRSKGVQVQAVLPGYTRTPMINDGAGLPDSAVMDAAAMVDAALAGFDAGELVTIPSLESPAIFDAWVEKRAALLPHLSLSTPASRYSAAKASAA